MVHDNKVDSVVAAKVVSREELFELVWAAPMLKVAKQFGVSSSYMARVCTAMNVPRPERGYWAKLAFGQTMRKPRLPETRPGDVPSWGPGGDLGDAPKTVPKAPAVEFLTPLGSIRKHSKQHPLVSGTKALFEGGRVSYWSEYLKPAKKLLVDLISTKTGVERALLFADALFWHFEDCGHRVVIAPEHENFNRSEVNPYEVPKKSNGFHDTNNLWSPRRPTVVYIGTVAIGLTVIELSEESDAKSIDGGYVRLELADAQRLKTRGVDSWRITKHDFGSNRVCLQAYSPYRTAKWTKQWREAKGVDLRKQIPNIVKELIEATPTIVELVREGERQAAIEHAKWEEDKKKWERERAEEQAAEAFKKSKDQLLQFIDGWTQVKRLREFFAEVSAHLDTADEDSRTQLQQRLDLARNMIGDLDALQGLRNWKPPAELLAEIQNKRSLF
jgi:hypothetical protein